MTLQAPRSALILLLALGACNQIPGAAVPEGSAAVASGDGSCGAESYQAYVGQRIDALNDVALPDDKRVLFPTTPATMDFVPGRLNIAVDKSDTISKIYCG